VNTGERQPSTLTTALVSTKSLNSAGDELTKFRIYRRLTTKQQAFRPHAPDSGYGPTFDTIFHEFRLNCAQQPLNH